MGVANNIKEVLQDYQLTKRTCQLCGNYLKSDNYFLSYRTNNDTDWTDFEPNKSRGWIAIEIELEHEECPENEK